MYYIYPISFPLCLPPLLPLSLSSPGNSILHSAADSVTSAVQKASQALNERGERLSRAEEKTGEMKNSAEQFSVTAHKVRHTHTHNHVSHITSLQGLAEFFLNT